MQKTNQKACPEIVRDLDNAEYLKLFGEKLSPTTINSKWITTSNQHEDNPGQSLVTRSHEVIRSWAEERKAIPATVPGTEHDGHLGVLMFNFPGFGGEGLKEVSWDDWFKTFDERMLVFIFQEHLKDGRLSNFFHLDSPLREQD